MKGKEALSLSGDGSNQTFQQRVIMDEENTVSRLESRLAAEQAQVVRSAEEVAELRQRSPDHQNASELRDALTVDAQPDGASGSLVPENAQLRLLVMKGDRLRQQELDTKFDYESQIIEKMARGTSTTEKDDNRKMTRESKEIREIRDMSKKEAEETEMKEEIDYQNCRYQSLYGMNAEEYQQMWD